MKLIQVLVFISMVLFGQKVFADDLSYEAIVCELNGLAIFLTVPMSTSWDELQMVKEAEKVCESMAAVLILTSENEEE